MPKKTPFYEIHEKLNATMTDFHGWLLPVYYTTPIEEHKAVRQKAGLFDTSHMGIVEIEGKDSEKLLQLLLVRDLADMKPGEMRLAVMCNEKGGILDDLTVYKFSKEKFWLVVNASPYESDLRQVQEKAEGMEVKATGLREHSAKLDLEGPNSEKILQPIIESDLGRMQHYDFDEVRIAGLDCVVSRSGYTGEQGFEIYFPAENAPELWKRLVEAGKDFGLRPCGLASRNTLRLEAGMLLYGQDIDEGKTPLQCNYRKLVDWKKDFVGKAALERQKKQGIGKKLVGFELVERGIARHNFRILKEGREAGTVTSGTYSPTLKKSIGLGYIGSEFSAIGTEFKIEIRGKAVKAIVAKLPFYKKR